MSSTPMKLEEVSKGKHWFTRLTTWSKRRLYTALAKASRALFACSTFRGTLQGRTKCGNERQSKTGACKSFIKSLISFIFCFNYPPNLRLAAWSGTVLFAIQLLLVKLGDRFKGRIEVKEEVLKLKYELWTLLGSLTTLILNHLEGLTVWTKCSSLAAQSSTQVSLLGRWWI